MSIILYINSKKINFFFEIGWFRGNDFSLFKLELFNKPDSADELYILSLQIIKFDITFGFNWE